MGGCETKAMSRSQKIADGTGEGKALTKCTGIVILRSLIEAKNYYVKSEPRIFMPYYVMSYVTRTVLVVIAKNLNTIETGYKVKSLIK